MALIGYLLYRIAKEREDSHKSSIYVLALRAITQRSDELVCISEYIEGVSQTNRFMQVMTSMKKRIIPNW